MEQAVFQKILDSLSKAVPKDWKKLILLAKYLTGKSSFEFFTKYDKSFISCFEDEKVKKTVSKEQLDEIFKKIDDILREEQKKNLKDKKPFTSFTMIVDNTGSTNALLDYEEIDKDEKGFDSKWKKTYLTESYYRVFEESELEWFFVKPLTSEDLLTDFESLYNVKLPQDFKELIKVSNGGSPSKALFDTDDVKRIQVINLLSFNRVPPETENEEAVYGIIDNLRMDPATSDLVPFASTGFNNYICLDRENKIVLYQDSSKDRLPVANSVTEFIGKLHE